MKNVVACLFVFFISISCHSIIKRRLINKNNYEILKQKGNVMIYVGNSINASDKLTVIVDDSILAVCSGYRGSSYAPFACIVNYDSQSSYIRVKAVLNDSVEVFFDKKIRVNKLNVVFIRKIGVSEIKVMDFPKK